ncbi:MAG: selenide, water dikinase SelD [Planctomycetes bacterium]|nr:selenide, water dikinase SelD [Planctomycetota bacterium]
MGGLKFPSHPDLLVGLDGADDASVTRLTDDLALVLTTDFFPPIVDDAYAFGQIAAANALSDVYAMGGRPLSALNLVCFPTKTRPLEELTAILQGGADKCAEAQASLSGGHTVEDREVKYGLAVAGLVHPRRIWKNGGVRVGDRLILTKPLGTGLVSSAVKADGLTGRLADEASRWMATLNGKGIDLIHATDVSSATDITGFGLVGHGIELADRSPAMLRLDSRSLPRLPGLEACLDQKYVTGGAGRNRQHATGRLLLREGLDPWAVELAFDPQTSGGLLIAVRPDQAEDLVRRLRDLGLEHCSLVGECADFDGQHRVELC